MDQRIEKEIELDGEVLDAEFTHNSHGWFCDRVGWIEWDYERFGAQVAKPTPEAAAERLIELEIEATEGE